MVFMVWLWIFDLWIPQGTKTFGCGFVHKHCDHMFRSGTLACTMLCIFVFCSHKTQKCLMSFMQMLCLIKAQFKSITHSKNESASYWLRHWRFCCFMPSTDLRTVSSLNWLLGEMDVTWSAVSTSSVLGAAVHSNTLPFDQLVNSIPHEATAALISLGGSTWLSGCCETCETWLLITIHRLMQSSVLHEEARDSTLSFPTA